MLPLHRASILTGRNSSGKSNALDAIEVLSRLARGDDLAEALDGRGRTLVPVRGRAEGCAPHGTDRFEIGCTVHSDGADYVFDVEVQVRPSLRIVKEQLRGPGRAVKSGRWHQAVDLVSTRPPQDGGIGLETEYHNGKRGLNPSRPVRDTRLASLQIADQLVPTNSAEHDVINGVTRVMQSLKGVFHLDPVPSLMRDYSPERDAELRRDGQNLSSALKDLQERDPQAFEQLVSDTKEIADSEVVGIDFETSTLGDVMMTLVEDHLLLGEERTPAREMSDGLLRFLAIATALTASGESLDLDTEHPQAGATSESVLLVLEEIENGLHPSQAARVLGLLQRATEREGTSVLVTTHSPALLDALEGSLNESVVVCYRDLDTGWSHLRPLIELPGYARAMAEFTLGGAISNGKLVDVTEPDRDAEDFKRLLGI